MTFRYPFDLGCLKNQSKLLIILHGVLYGSFRNPNELVWTNFLEWTMISSMSMFATKVAYVLVRNMQDRAFNEGGWILVSGSHKSDSTFLMNVTLIVKDHVQGLATKLKFLQGILE